MMNSVDARRAARAMSSGRYGSFAEHLGNAYLVADSHNKEKIEDTFEDLLKKVLADIGEVA